jgi:hypothetical protein
MGGEMTQALYAHIKKKKKKIEFHELFAWAGFEL